MGTLLLQLGREDEARAIWESILDPQKAQSRRTLATLYQENEFYTEALAHMRAYLEKVGERNTGDLQFLADLALRTGDTDGALAAYERALVLAADNDGVRASLRGRILDVHRRARSLPAYRDDLAARWNLNLVTLRAPEPKVGLWQTSTDDCCARHKVGPLFSALEGYDVWFTGLRREQSPSRANLEETEDFRLPSGRVLRKVSPLARWTTKEVWAYAKSHDIPLLPLYDVGYSSIGCEPCTSLPDDPSNPRSGRWAGKKLECGIHIEPSRP
jgi:phosphoadenosine phosphosulfate reductase